MKSAAQLDRLEAIVDASGIAARVEALLPVGVRPRQLSVRTLLVGMLLVACEGRPAHLSRVHEALLALPEAEKRRLGVIAEWKSGPHVLTYRQVERTLGLVARALAKAEPDGEPSEALSEIIDALLEASVEVCGEPASNSYAVDWTDLETFSVPPPKGGGDCADPEASWGHRRGNSPGERDEVFFGYYLQVVTAVKEERGPAVAELVRRIQIGSCEVDPPTALVPALERMADERDRDRRRSSPTPATPTGWRRRGRCRCGAWGPGSSRTCIPTTAGRRGPTWGRPSPTERSTARPHPPRCWSWGRFTAARARPRPPPTTPRRPSFAATGWGRSPAMTKTAITASAVPPPGASCAAPCGPSQWRSTTPAPRSSPHPSTRPPAAPSERSRCLPRSTRRPRKSTTTPRPSTAAPTRGARPPSAPTRRSRTRPQTTSQSGWCRLTGLAPIALFAACVFVARNLRVADAFAARVAEDERRAANGLAPRRRKRRRKSAGDLIGAANAPP